MIRPATAEGTRVGARCRRTGAVEPGRTIAHLAAGPALAACAALAGCDGPQSALVPAGRDAERILVLFWWMVGGGVVVWTLVMSLTVYAIRAAPRGDRSAARLLIHGGIALPTVMLAILLSFGLAAMPKILALPAAPRVIVRVTGEQWWWRVRYVAPDGSRPAVELANEIRLPLDERILLELDSADVVHSFWVPALGGKVDMIPGRTTRLALEPTRTGTFRGICAEFCGLSHACMNFDVVVMLRAEFDRWLDAQRRPASPPDTALTARGAEVFRSTGCGACHAVRGTDARGVIGPDLTHVGGRLSLGGGILPNDRAAFREFLVHTERLKPGVRMPQFDMLAEDELEALAAYLDDLR